jgi:hypothetical protein
VEAAVKVKREVEVNICDACKTADAGYSACLNCGKAFCYDCRKIHAVEFPHSLHCSGSDDGLYCVGCVTELTQSGDPLLMAYRAITNLRAESNAYYKALETRAEECGSRIKQLLAQRGR